MAVPEEQAGLCVARDKDVSVDTFVVTARDSAIEEPGRTCELEPVFADDDIAAAELTGAQAIAIERIFEAKRQSRFRGRLAQQRGGSDIELVAVEHDLATACPIGRIDLDRQSVV